MKNCTFFCHFSFPTLSLALHDAERRGVKFMWIFLVWGCEQQKYFQSHFSSMFSVSWENHFYRVRSVRRKMEILFCKGVNRDKSLYSFNDARKLPWNRWKATLALCFDLTWGTGVLCPPCYLQAAFNMLLNNRVSHKFLKLLVSFCGMRTVIFADYSFALMILTT